MNELIATIGRFFGHFTFWVAVSPWEQALRVRAGKHVAVLGPGMHWRIPALDAVYVQSVRLRSAMMPTQTLATVDGHAVVASATLGYAIADIRLLYQGLHHAEDTLVNRAAAALATYVTINPRASLTAEALSAAVTSDLALMLAQYGLVDVEVRITDFAFIRAYRLVQDQRWSHAGADPLATNQARTP